MKKIFVLSLTAIYLLNTHCSDVGNNFSYLAEQGVPEVQTRIASFVVDTPIDQLTAQQNILFDTEIKLLCKKHEIKLTEKEKKALALPFKKRHKKMIGTHVIARKHKQGGSERYNFSDEDYQYASAVPECILKNFDMPAEVNVHKTKKPYQKILKRTGQGFIFGFGTGLLVGLGITHANNKPISTDRVGLSLVTGLSFGVAGAVCSGTHQAVKEYNKGNLTKAKVKKLIKQS